MNDLSETHTAYEENVATESLDFGTKWREMLMDTFAVAKLELAAEIETLNDESSNQVFRVTDVKRKGRLIECNVDGYLAQMAVLFKPGAQLQIQSGNKHLSTYNSLWGVSNGISMPQEEGQMWGKVRLYLDLTSKGQLEENGEISVSVDVLSRKMELEKKAKKIREFVARMEKGKGSDLQRMVMTGDFRVKPERALSKNAHLDDSQNEAFGRAMLYDDYPVLFVQGPPGTGKTRTIREIIDGHLQHGRRVLVLSHSNRGMNEPAMQLLEKWLETEHKKKAGKMAKEKIFIAGNVPEKIDPDLRRFRIKRDYKFPEKQLRKIVNMSDDELVARCGRPEGSGRGSFGFFDPNLREVQNMRRQLRDAVIYDHKAKCRKADEKFMLSMSQGGAVFSTFGNLLNDKVLDGMYFDVVIVDESTRMQSLELVQALEKAGKQIVFVGDPEQLGNIPMDPEAEQKVSVSLEGSEVPELITDVRDRARSVYDSESASRALEVFQDGPYKHGIKCSKDPDRDLPFVFLRNGRRSLPNITNLVSEYTYGGRLIPAREAVGGNRGAVLWLDTKKLRGGEKAVGTSRRNLTESQIIGRKAVHALLKQGISPSDIGIIATYASQVHAIRNGISRILRGTEEGQALFEELKSNIDSVDGFQGDQKNVVFMSFTRSNPHGNVGFTDEGSRINVGISRAANCLIIVGDTSTLIDNNQDPVSRARFEKLRDLFAKYGKVGVRDKFHNKRKRKRKSPDERRESRRKARERRAAFAA
jgi:hypothetical protein